MQSVHQTGVAVPLRPPLVSYLMKSLLLLFGAAVALSYGYELFIHLRSGTLLPRLVLLPIATTVTFVLGWLIDRKHPGHRIAFLLLLMAYCTGFMIVLSAGWQRIPFLTGPHIPMLSTVWLVLGHTVWLPGVFIPLLLMPLYFPTGRLLSPRWRVVVALILVNPAWMALTVALRPWPWPEYGIWDTRPINGIAGSEPFFDTIGRLLGLASWPILPLVLIAMALRFRRARGIERVQMKWPLLGVGGLVAETIILLFFPSLAEWDAQHDFLITWTLAMLFPFSMGVAILRHNLWDIDIIVNRTIVYGSLTALIVAIYIAIVAGLGALFESQTNLLTGLVAAGVVALLFHPLRGGLQRRVNRMLYGERDDPAAVLSRLAHQLESAGAPSAILPDLVQTIAHTLKIPYVAIWLPGGADQTQPVAVWGATRGPTQTIPLTVRQEVIGHLVVAPRGPHERFTRHERELLATIAALTATTVQAVQLSDKLRRSRLHIVTAREDERRRLRRDLHDGLGPQLASQTLGLEAVAQLIPSNPEKAQTVLSSLKQQAEEAIRDVRRIVYDLRPPALDDLGLLGALRQSAARYETGELHFRLNVPSTLPELPAAVETAVYRIAQEAMTNVVRHAEATSCTIRLYCADGEVVVEVRDDGRGLARNHPSGVGLQAMKERATELDGQLVLDALPGGGTLVQARLPLEVHDG
jgi:signal transduction histidine kinase